MFSWPLVFFFVPVFGNEEDDSHRERTRRNSDSVVYVKPKENEVTVVLSKLKQVEIKFQQEKIDRLEKEISKISEENEATVEMSKTSQVWIELQQEKIDRLEEEISRISETQTEEELILGDNQLGELNTEEISAGKKCSCGTFSWC